MQEDWMHKRFSTVLIMGILLGLAGCSLPVEQIDSPSPAGDEDSSFVTSSGSQDQVEAQERPELEVVDSALLHPDDLVYLGAFRLPPGQAESAWDWGGAALTFYPDGDPQGDEDGFPGSLFGTGHDWTQMVSEVSIPAPVLSASKQLSELPTAVTLQDFADLRADLFPHLD
jgi:hypothetical protein